MTVNRPIVIAAVPTLFADDGSVDLQGHERLCGQIAESGVDALFVGGTTAEFPALDHHERVDVVRAALAAVPPSRVIAQVGAASAWQAVRLTERIRSLGVPRIAAVTPYPLPAGRHALLEYYKQICASADGADVYAYIYPKLTNTTVQPDQLAELAELPGLVGAKVSISGAAPIAAYATAVRRGFVLLSGSDVDLAAVVRAGGHGIVSGVASAIPEPFLALAAALASSDANTEQKAQADVNDAVAAIDGNIELLKLALRLRDLPSGASRMAFDPPDNASLDRLTKHIEKLTSHTAVRQ